MTPRFIRVPAAVSTTPTTNGTARVEASRNA
jgi:hypothetical protein